MEEREGGGGSSCCIFICINGHIFQSINLLDKSFADRNETVIKKHVSQFCEI